MKLNRNINIILGVVVSIAVLIALMIIFMNKNTDIEENKYYGKELTNQDRIELIKNTKALNGKVYFGGREKNLNIVFPNDKKLTSISGKILFYNLSDKGKDFILDFNVPESKKSVSVFDDKIIKGSWKIKLLWNSNNEKYYSVDSLNID